MTNPAYDSVWRRTRTQILDRDGHVCQIQLPGCKHTATEVDHIIRLSEGGHRLDPNNLRAACKPCNLARQRGRTAELANTIDRLANPKPPTRPSPNW